MTLKNKILGWKIYETVGTAVINPAVLYPRIDSLLKVLNLTYNINALFSKCSYNSNSYCCKCQSYLAIGNIYDNKIRISGACEQHYYILSAKGYLKDKRIMYTQQQVDNFIEMANVLC